jgi:hypothetical protein
MTQLGVNFSGQSNLNLDEPSMLDSDLRTCTFVPFSISFLDYFSSTVIQLIR